jgi:hypothetical protein
MRQESETGPLTAKLYPNGRNSAIGTGRQAPKHPYGSEIRLKLAKIDAEIMPGDDGNTSEVAPKVALFFLYPNAC